MRCSKRTARKEALAHGYRSNFEYDFFKQLETYKLKAEYETEKLSYIVPETKKTYTPDWVIGESIFIETKGRFSSPDRKKILLVRKCNPKAVLYLLFQNSKITLSKKSKTTYAEWCDKNGLIWSDIRDIKRWRAWFEKEQTI